jgi:hypothetical protein
MTQYREYWRGALFSIDELLYKNSETITYATGTMEAGALVSRGLKEVTEKIS